MRTLVYLLLLALVVLHQDYWNWHTHEPLVLGFIPIGLAWHVGISLMAGVTGLLAVQYCWPADVDVAEPSAAHGAESPQPRADSGEGRP